MRTLLLLSLFLSTSAFANLLPAEKSEAVVSDELFSYQWSLFNQGQTYLKERDDIHNIPLKGLTGKDIDWKSFKDKLGTKRPVVAILDTGVDLDHPDIKAALWTNEKECGKDPKVDNDGNKLKGDCQGWNFTADAESDAAKSPQDNDGHGSHVAGIIAAQINDYGIAGINPNIQIMPIKVMGSTSSDTAVPTSESFARGIQYAADNGADVINMSLGWPKSLETENLRRAVFAALQKGVIIVAAAGNNNSPEPLFPCAYEGVICVAASTLDGSYAGFSNYGGHVDVVAPGEGILSLHPTAFEPDFFSVNGFEVRSGTSQAAPAVTALIATLKAQKSTITTQEIMARIYSTPALSDSRKYSLSGSVSWDILGRDITTPVIRPIFKKQIAREPKQIVIAPGATVGKFNFPLKNFGVDAGRVSLKLESLSPSISVVEPESELESLKSGESKVLSYDIKIEDMTLESFVKLKLTVETESETRSFTFELPIVRDVKSNPETAKFTFKFLDKPVPLAAIRNGDVVTTLTTVETFTNSAAHEFFVRRIIRDGEKSSKLEITIFEKLGNEFVQKQPLIIENAVYLVNFKRADLNFDGKEDYLVNTLIREGDKVRVLFSFFNKDLTPVWKDFQNVKVDLSVIVDNFMNLLKDQSPLPISVVTYQHPKLGKMMVPAFITKGQLPKIDQVLTSWDRQDVGRKARIYYLEPEKDTFRIRALTTKVWEEALKKELKSKWMDTVEVEDILPRSADDVKKGEVRGLVSVGSGTARALYVYALSPAKSIHGPKIPQLVLQTDGINPLLKVSPEGLQNNGDVYFNIYDRERAKVITTKETAQDAELIYRHPSETDLIVGQIASFENGSKRTTIIQTREELISITTMGSAQQRIGRRPKLRYSFLSQRLLTELYYPVIYKRNGVQSAALYVDATSMTGNRINLIEEQNGNLVSSIKNSVLVPANCKALNPMFSASAGAHELTFLCIEESGPEVRTIPLN
ncbi:MAG: S8 family peptidase [Bdellovibrionota bacterium]